MIELAPAQLSDLRKQALGVTNSTSLTAWLGAGAAVQAARLAQEDLVAVPLQDFLAAPRLHSANWRLVDQRSFAWYWTGVRAPTTMAELFAAIERAEFGAIRLAVQPEQCALAKQALATAFSADAAVSQRIFDDLNRRGRVGLPLCEPDARAEMLFTQVGSEPMGSRQLTYLNRGKRAVSGTVLIDLRAGAERTNDLDASSLIRVP